ncbi:MAG TPA: hypothetical protein VFZ66_01910 [Herpetosiphonaceae bacterium]
MVIPSGEATGTLTITSDLRGPFRTGDQVPICWTASGLSLAADSFEAYLFMDGNQRSVSLGGMGTAGCLPLPLTMPFVSTDSARVGIKIYGTYNRVKWFFSEPFTIRPDARIPDAAPTVALLSPVSGASIAPGSSVPIAWSASDDEGLRSFDVHGSYDGGRTWHVIARDLPGSARSYTWQTAPGSGFASVQVRVVAHDLRFQNSSATNSSGTTPPPATPTPTPAPTLTPTPLPTATATPTPDTVSISRAEYTVSKKQLRVEASSTRSAATLKAYVTATGEYIGTLSSGGNGRYSGQWSWPVNPQNITVRSSLGGTATRSVTAR